MSLLQLHLLGSPVLRQHSEVVPSVDEDVRRLIADMLETMDAAKGIGLAANQVGVARRVAVVDVDDDRFVMVNPRIVETQLSGAAIMQLGFTLLEKMQFDERGQLRNASLAEYRIPGFLDIPAVITNEAVVAEQRTGPFGAKGVGETGTFGVSPAIANAVHDAVGVRISSLPLTPEAIFMAMQK